MFVLVATSSENLMQNSKVIPNLQWPFSESLALVFTLPGGIISDHGMTMVVFEERENNRRLLMQRQNALEMAMEESEERANSARLRVSPGRMNTTVNSL